MSTDTNTNARLTEEERETFASLAEAYEGEPLGEVFESALQSDSKEDTTS